MLRGLHHLTLKEIKLGPSLSDLLRILAASPALTTLVLRQLGGTHDDPPENHGPIILSQLTELQIVQLNPNYTSKLLQSIRAPKCCIFALECHFKTPQNEPSNEANPPSAISFLNDTLTPFLESLTTILSHSTNFSVNLAPVSVACHNQVNTQCSFRLALFGIQSSSRVFEWVVDAFHTPLMKVPVAINVSEPFNISDPAFMSALAGLDRVERFKASQNTIIPGTFLAYLQKPYIKDGIQHWNLPWLRELLIGAAEDWSRLLPMIRSRYGLDRTPGVVAQRPARFKWLYVAIDDLALAKHLSAIVGKFELELTKSLQTKLDYDRARNFVLPPLGPILPA